MPQQDIAADCIDYQRTASWFAHDAMYDVEQGIIGAAKHNQEKARTYYAAAQDRLSRLLAA